MSTLRGDAIVDGDELPIAVKVTGTSMLEVVQAVLFPAESRLRDDGHPQNPIHTV